MPEPQSDPEERNFADLLRQGVRDLREERGPCPSPDVLEAFHEGRLTPEENSHVGGHVEACGLCDLQLARFEGSLPKERSLPSKVFGILGRPLVPYALLALLLYPAYRGLFHSNENLVANSSFQGEQKPEFGLGTIPGFSLNTERSNSPLQNQTLVQISSQEKFFLLSFFVPIKAMAGYRYTVTASHADGSAVAPVQDLKDCDSLGNCFLLCNTALFAPGPYRLKVEEIGSTGATATFFFPFVLKRLGSQPYNAPTVTKGAQK